MLLSLKQIYVQRVFSGQKQFEYRTRFWTDSPGWVYVYAGRPTKKIVGRVRDMGILRGDKFRIWNVTHEHAGISAMDFFDYFAGSSTAKAMIIGQVEKFPAQIDPYVMWPGFRAVQSWKYLTPEEEQDILLNLNTLQPTIAM